MENIMVSKYMRLLAPLSVEIKLEIIKKLSESLKLEFRPKKEEISEKDHLLDELAGAWKDMDENLEEDIYNSRTISDKDIFNL